MSDATDAPAGRFLDRARSAAHLGLPVPAGAHFRFLKRVHARLGWFLTKRQIEHNLAVIAAVDALAKEMRDHRRRVAEVLAEVEMSLRTEVLAARQQDDQRSIDLANLASRLGALRADLEQMRSVGDSERASSPGGRSDADGVPGAPVAGITGPGVPVVREGHPVTSLRSVRNER